MKLRTISLVIVLMVLATAWATETYSQNGLEIYLPQQMTVDTNTISLGQASVLSGEQTLAAEAAKISLGIFSVPGQRITIDRQMILGRLAANNISAGRVSMSGAEQVVVGRGEQIIKGSDIAEYAIGVLKKSAAYSSAADYISLRTPADLVIGKESREIKLVPRLLTSSTATLARVEFAAFADGKEAGKREAVIRIIKDKQSNTTAAEQRSTGAQEAKSNSGQLTLRVEELAPATNAGAKKSMAIPEILSRL